METSGAIVLSVEGMHCGGCVRRVRQALAGLDGVRDVQVDLSNGRVVVERSAPNTSAEAAVEALRRAGYQAAAAPTG